MSLRRVLPYVAILVVGQAVLDAGPAIVAEREGGMGLGSALIAAVVAQVAGIVLGAVMAVSAVDRRSVAVALLVGAFLFYAGLMTTGIAPMGSLVTVVAGMGLAGIGFGSMLTAAFAAAAEVGEPRARVTAVVLLLAAPVAARIAVGTTFAAGPTAFIIGGVAVVGLALAATHLGGALPRRVVAGDPPQPATSVGRVAFSALVLAFGAMLAVAGADPSRLSATLIAGTLGMGGFDAIDTVRAALFTLGIVLLAVGAVPQLAAGGRVVRIAAPGLLLVGFAGSGIAAALSLALTAGRMPDGTSALIGAATAVGAGVGFVTASMLIGGRRDRRVPAVIGGATLTLACVLGWLTLLGHRPEPGDMMPIVLVGGAGPAMWLAAAALRVALAEVRAPQRGLAAGSGVAAAVIGTTLGGMIGAAEGLSTLGSDPRGIPVGLVGFMIAGAAAVALTAALPRAEPVASSTRIA